MAATGIGSSGSAAEVIRPALAQPRPDAAADAARRPGLVHFDRNVEAWRAARRAGGPPPDRQGQDGQPPSRAATGGGQNLASNYTAFLAQYFGQAEATTEVESTFRSGAAAYRATASRTRQPDQPPVEVLPPAASSGHSLDLTI